MLGDLIFDKCRLLYKKSAVSQENRELMKSELLRLFPTAQVGSKAGYIHNTFNPAKLVDSARKIDYNHNLQMPSEKRLSSALKQVYSEDVSSVWASVCHLTKNIVLPNPVSEYIAILSDINTPYVISETIEANVSTSLYLHFDKNDEENEETPHFRIKFYDKGAEYCKRHDNPICQLYEPLTAREIELLGTSYNPATHTVDMSTVNILRIEVELVQKDKLTPILKRIAGTPTKLTLPIIIESLDNKSLYGILENVFNEKLKRYVFTATKTLNEIAEQESLSKMNKIACQLQLEDTSSKHFTALMTELGYKDNVATMNKIVRKIVPNSELYQELYSAFFNSDNEVITDEATEKPTDTFAEPVIEDTANNSELVSATASNSTDVVDFIVDIIQNLISVSRDLYSSLTSYTLVYSVPILDDS